MYLNILLRSYYKTSVSDQDGVKKNSSALPTETTKSIPNILYDGLQNTARQVIKKMILET